MTQERCLKLETALREAADALDACAEALEQAFPAPEYGQGSVAMIREWAAKARRAVDHG